MSANSHEIVLVVVEKVTKDFIHANKRRNHPNDNVDKNCPPLHTPQNKAGIIRSKTIRL